MCFASEIYIPLAWSSRLMRQKYRSNSGSGRKQAVGITQRVSVHFFASVISWASVSQTRHLLLALIRESTLQVVVLSPPFPFRPSLSFLCVSPQSFNTQQAAVQVLSLSRCLSQSSLALWLCTQHCMSQPTQTLTCPEVTQCRITFREYLHDVNSHRQVTGTGCPESWIQYPSGKLILKDYPNKISIFQEYSPGIWRHHYRKEPQMHGSA